MAPNPYPQWQKYNISVHKLITNCSLKNIKKNVETEDHKRGTFKIIKYHIPKSLINLFVTKLNHPIILKYAYNIDLW